MWPSLTITGFSTQWAGAGGWVSGWAAVADSQHWRSAFWINRAYLPGSKKVSSNPRSFCHLIFGESTVTTATIVSFLSKMINIGIGYSWLCYTCTAYTRTSKYDDMPPPERLGNQYSLGKPCIRVQVVRVFSGSSHHRYICLCVYTG